MTKNLFPETPKELGPASLTRRLAAITYDALLVIALLMVTTAIYMLVSAAVLGSERYQSLSESGKTIGDPLLSSILFIILYFFFGYFWTKNGQTLGMQAWHIRVQNSDRTSISWSQALLRFIAAFVSIATFGLGYLWIMLDPQHRSWHCMFSNTQVVRINKRK